MEKKKIIIPIVTIAVIGAVGGTGYYYRDTIIDVATEAFDVVSEKIPFLQSGKSDDKVYVEKVSKIMNTYTGNTNRYNGVVESQDSYEVNVDSSRTIKEILVKVGDEVEEGQTLVTYDTSDLEMQVKQAKLELEGIQNEIDSSNKKIATLNDELNKTTDEDDKFSLKTDIQSEENSIEENKLDLESKNLEISKYEDQINASSVVSKRSGIVKEINENGTDSNGNSAAFMTILQAGEYRVKGSIDEQNVWMVSDGQSVIIRSRVDESQTWNGTISKVDTDNVQKSDDDSSSDNTVSATKYPFYVELSSADGLLLGQHVYIELDEGQEEKKEGVWLYSNYIVQDDSGAYVWAANDKNRLEKRYVELGEYDEDLAEYEILDGLSLDDYITWPMEGLYEGVTTVTDVSEVDYSSPLYNQDGTEMLDYGTEMLYENGMYDYDTEMMLDEGMQNYVDGNMGNMSDYDETDDDDSDDYDDSYDDSDEYDDSADDTDSDDSDDSYDDTDSDDSGNMEVGE